MKFSFEHKRFLLIPIALFLFLATGQVFAQSQWELTPTKHSFLESGTMTGAEGATDENGVRFLLNDNKFNQPVVVSLTAKDPTAPITIKMASESWDKVHREVVTDDTGRYTGTFRGEGLMAFWLTGASGAEYELAVWVGPAQDFTRQSTLISMDEVGPAISPSASQSPAIVTSSDTPQPPTTSQPNQKSEVPIWALISVGVSILCLIGMGVMFSQLRNSKSASNMVVFGLCLSLMATQVARADVTPSTLDTGQLKTALKTMIQGLRSLAGGGATNNEANSASGAASNDPIVRAPDSRTTGELSGNRSRQARIDQSNRTRRRANTFRNTRNSMKSAAANGANMLELARATAEFFYPSVAPLAPDYLPPGLPQLPTRSFGDVDSETLRELKGAEAQLLAIVQRMEKNRYHHQVLMAKVGAFHDFAGAAGSANPIAGIHTMKVKNDPWLTKKIAGHRAQYDEAFQVLITQGNESLLGMAKIEREAFGDQDWYNRFGLPFYTYMNNRYQRRR